ncbi:uncharacterized protein JCM15063_001476 [Sporobolomyces koalae]|uniref:uncharacterized protein n=1 Tax=Sporobolomyces koalae TaxID=500713 RepID=UPI003178C8DE
MASTVSDALNHLADSLRSLPPQASIANITELSTLLSQFSSDVAPLLSVVLKNEEQAFLSNSTWISEHLAEVEHLIARLPSSTVQHASRTELIELVKFDSLKYTIWQIWSPDVWTLLLFFFIAIVAKVLFNVGLNKRAVERTRVAMSAQYGHEVETDVARTVLRKNVGSILGWILNITVETTCLILQLCAWRLFAINSEMVRIRDIQILLIVIKTLLISYIADLLLGDHGADVYLHHVFSFILLFVGQCTFFDTHNPLFFRLATWMLLQATLIIPIYVGLGLIQVQRYYQLQNYKPQDQLKFLGWSHKFLRVTSWVYIPQKLIPAAFCLYWLGKMWNDVKHSSWGIAWLVIATVTVTLLLFLQVFIISDRVVALTAYIGYKAHGGPIPPRAGPIARSVARMLGKRGGPRRGSCDSDATAVDIQSSSLASSKDKEKELMTDSETTSPAISTSPSTTTVYETLPNVSTYKAPEDSPV